MVKFYKNERRFFKARIKIKNYFSKSIFVNAINEMKGWQL